MIRKVIKIMLYILLALAILASGAGLYLKGNFGAMPSREDEATFARLPYYKDGQFQSPAPLHYDFDNVRNGPAGWFRFLFRSKFAPTPPLPKVMLNRSSFPEQPEDYALYWLGHSAAIMDLGGKRFIFDPVLDNAAPVPKGAQRFDVAPIKREDLPAVDYILITHNHYDHLEKKTVKAIKSGHFIVPLGLGAALRGWGLEAARITELGWDESFEQEGIKISAVEGVHYSGRSPFDRNKTLWNSYVIKTKDKNIFWGGDTGYGKHFARIGKVYGPFDLAALEIDGWNTGWPNTHLFPHEVVQAALDLRVHHLLPIHWAVFDLALHPLHESIDMLLEEAKNKDLRIITPRMGEKIVPGSSQTQHWWKEQS